ncbi:MAG TPA: hypothetical protein VGM25_16160, partial [Caulobacteraceae bacterium]
LARASANPADSATAASPAQSDQGNQQGAAAPAAGSTPADMFSSSTLGALTSAQENGGDWRQQMDSDLAGQMVGQLDGNGDGTLSLSEVENALGVSSGTATGGADGADANGASSSTAAQDGVSAAFTQIDANGDGQLSADELTNALNQAQAPVHRGGGGHHHHHGGGAPPDALDTDSTTTTTDAAGVSTSATDPTDPFAVTADTTTGTAAGTTTASGGSGSSSSDLSNAAIAQAVQAFAAQIQQQAASLEAMLQSSASSSVTA